MYYYRTHVNVSVDLYTKYNIKIKKYYISIVYNIILFLHVYHLVKASKLLFYYSY